MSDSTIPQTRRERRTLRKCGGVLTTVALFLAVALVAAGGYLVWQSAQPGEPSAAPLPSREFTGPGDALLDGSAVKPPSSFPKRDMGYQPAPVDLSDLPGSSVAVPSLGIVAPYESSTKDERDVWNIPRDINRTALLDTGVGISAPHGTRIIAGHVDAAGEGPGALHDLYLVKPGALVVTTDASGAQQRWVVTSLRAFVKQALPADIFDREGRPRLALVTCGGPVLNIGGVHQYRDNVVAVAVPVTQDAPAPA